MSTWFARYMAWGRFLRSWAALPGQLMRLSGILMAVAHVNNTGLMWCGIGMMMAGNAWLVASARLAAPRSSESERTKLKTSDVRGSGLT